MAGVGWAVAADAPAFNRGYGEDTAAGCGSVLETAGFVAVWTRSIVGFNQSPFLCLFLSGAWRQTWRGGCVFIFKSHNKVRGRCGLAAGRWAGR